MFFPGNLFIRISAGQKINSVSPIVDGLRDDNDTDLSFSCSNATGRTFRSIEEVWIQAGTVMAFVRVKQIESASYQVGVTFSGILHGEKHSLPFPARFSDSMGKGQPYQNLEQCENDSRNLITC